MKMIFAVAAALAAAVSAPAMAASAPAPAAAAVAAPQERVVVRERTTVRRDYRPRNRWRTRRVCNVRWRNHRRVRVCRTVRYRY